MRKKRENTYCATMCRILVLSAAIMVVAALSGCDRNFNLTSGNLKITLDQDANVTGVQVGQTNLKVSAAPLVSLCPVDKGQFYPARIVGGSLARGLKLDFGEARATANLKIVEHEGSIKFAIDLQGKNLPARGMLLRFSFPVDATGWQWHDDINTHTNISDKIYEDEEPMRYNPILPEFRDQPDLRMGYCSRNFCAAITGPAGLCIAVPINRPCVFRAAYDGIRKSFDITYDFALTPDSRKSNAVGFDFDFYSFDPAWGMRGALAKYYRMYSEYFRVHKQVSGQGGIYAAYTLDIDNANEFYLALQFSAGRDVEYEKKIGMLSCHYFSYNGLGANLPPPYDPVKDPLPPHEAQVAAMEQAFKKATGQDNVYEQVGVRRPDGKLDVRKWDNYYHLLAQATYEPRLPYGKYLVDKAVKEATRESNPYDGFFYDSLSRGTDYATNHFNISDDPIMWDPANKAPYVNNFFASLNYARAMAEALRPLGKITTVNAENSFFAVPWVDGISKEVWTDPELWAHTVVKTKPLKPGDIFFYCRDYDFNFNHFRMILYHKPFYTLLKGNFEMDMDRSKIEFFMKRCLAYGFFPGFFDWMSSGVGPGGEYYDHPLYYERDRDLHRKYQPLCRALAMAGWEPVPHARSSNTKISVERFGPTPEGMLWLTLLNEEKDDQEITLSIAAKDLGLDAESVRALEVVNDKPVKLTVSNNCLAAELVVPVADVLALQIASPDIAAKWRVDQALETLERGVLMRTVDADKPAAPVHWRSKGHVARERGGAKNNLVFSSGASLKGKVPWGVETFGTNMASETMQWVMLFQTSASELKLKVRAAGENLPNEKSAGVCCRLARVVPGWTRFTNETFYLPPGTYDYRDFEFTIKPEHELRSILMFPVMAANLPENARLKIASISLGDAAGKEYVTDGEFKEWYEPIPKGYCRTIDDGMANLRGTLIELQKNTDKREGNEFKERMGKASAQIEKLRGIIADKKMENTCRRVLRDLETIKSHLDHIK